jgi:hypothetical protein
MILAETTNINRNQQKSTESAKVSKSEQKSAKVSKNRRRVPGPVSKNQQKSALLCAGL